MKIDALIKVGRHFMHTCVLRRPVMYPVSL